MSFTKSIKDCISCIPVVLCATLATSCNNTNTNVNRDTVSKTEADTVTKHTYTIKMTAEDSLRAKIEQKGNVVFWAYKYSYEIEDSVIQPKKDLYIAGEIIDISKGGSYGAFLTVRSAGSIFDGQGKDGYGTWPRFSAKIYLDKSEFDKLCKEAKRMAGIIKSRILIKLLSAKKITGEMAANMTGLNDERENREEAAFIELDKLSRLYILEGVLVDYSIIKDR